MMRNRREEIKAENRRSIPLFILLILAGGIVGAVLGGVGSWLQFSYAEGQVLISEYMIARISMGLMIAVALVVHIAGWIIFGQCKRQLGAWDREDEAIADQIELKASYVLCGISVNMVLSFACFGALIITEFNGSGDLNLGVTMAAVVIFLINMGAGVVLQQKFVDLIKEMNPEKRGSVYDVRFTKRWMESCDEAEKMQIYQSAWTSYRWMSVIYPIVWLIAYFISTFFNLGIFANIIISFLWLMQICVYYYESIRLLR